MTRQPDYSHRQEGQGAQQPPAKPLRTLVFFLVGCVVAIVLVVGLAQLASGATQMLAYGLVCRSS